MGSAIPSNSEKNFRNYDPKLFAYPLNYALFAFPAFDAAQHFFDTMIEGEWTEAHPYESECLTNVCRRMFMSISGISAAPPVKIEVDTGAKADESPSLASNKFVDKALSQPDGNDQRIESRLAVVRQQVSGSTDTADSNAATLKRPRVSNDLNYALTQVAIQGDSKGSDQNQSNSDESGSQQSRDQASARIEKEIVDKPKIQF